MRLWAFCTSPHGLALHPDDFGLLSSREFYALQEIQQAEVRRWAISQAIFVNMTMATSEEPFLADDFLGTGNRMQRQRERMEGQRAAERLNRKLIAITPTKAGDAEPEWLPDWARKTPKEAKLG